MNVTDSTVTLAAPPTPAQPNFGPNVLIFDPSMPTSQIQAAVDAVAAQQVDSEMGTGRYALLFKPGVYGSAAQPLTFQVGYYTEVAGLGASPTDVTINGHVDVYNRCLGPNNSNCIALDNFWRSLSNLTINVTGLSDCRSSGDFWAVSQAAPMRRVNITGGNLTLMDYCTAGPQFASGGFIADSQTGFIINGSQQQFVVRNSTIGGWSNAVWNQVFSGVQGAPAQSFPNPTYTTLDKSPLTREKPFLYVDAAGKYNVFVPAPQKDSVGTSWASGSTAGSSIPLSRFFVATPSDSVKKINVALATGMNVLFTPGIYHLDRTIEVKRPDSVVLGLGLPTLIPDNGVIAMQVADVPGVKLAGMMFDAGTVKSPVLLQVGTPNERGDDNRSPNAGKSDPADPSTLHDIFFRIGGDIAGKATTALVINNDNVIMDDIWSWRADHGNPGTVGWTINTADTGLIVNGDNVTAYGLFVEHYQKYEVIWRGNNGKVIFFQNEMPYDPPSQAAWMEAPNVLGWAAFKVTDNVKTFNGWGMGSYSFFNQGVDIYAARAFEVPDTLPAGSLHDLLTIFLDPSNGKGGILNVVNNTGGSSTIANPDVPVTVVSYP
ncbi:MAG TPA: adenylyl cyclase [Chloroflexia bacterium]|nr:adenylyl cyclase [Chloroflexia bacterium]